MRSRREVVRDQKIALFFAVMIVLSAVFFSCLFKAVSTQAASTKKSFKYYTSVQVQPGDTLWGIAGTYISEDEQNMIDYIEEIRRLNRLPDDTIHAGAYLTVPYLSSQKIE